MVREEEFLTLILSIIVPPSSMTLRLPLVRTVQQATD